MRRRSVLFVPAHVEKFVGKSAGAGADAVVLDLEDAVPAAQKVDARKALPAAIARLGGSVLVRVDADSLEADLAACAEAGAPEVLLPKVDGPADIERFQKCCAAMGYGPELSVLVESGRGVAAVNAILTCAPVVSAALGAEDLRVELEWFKPDDAPVSPTLMFAHSSLILAALAADVHPLGLIGAIGNVRDPDRLRAGAVQAWRMGYRGSLCIHPSQVPVLNAEFAPSAADVRWARAAVDAADEAAREGRGAVLVDGEMVDAPLVERARRILAADPGEALR